MISIHIYNYGKNETLLAACDFELLGKNFSEKELKLEVKESFYGGEIITEEEFLKKLERATNVNLVGEKAVNKAVEFGFVKKQSVVKIQGVPHVQIVHV